MDFMFFQVHLSFHKTVLLLGIKVLIPILGHQLKYIINHNCFIYLKNYWILLITSFLITIIAQQICEENISININQKAFFLVMFQT
jgi:hypothetical protein